MSDIYEKAIVHVRELAESMECGARMEDAIVAAYQPELDAFSNRYKDKDSPHDIRLIRAVLDARTNRDRFLKDAAALRVVLAHSPPGASPADRQPSPRDALDNTPRIARDDVIPEPARLGEEARQSDAEPSAASAWQAAEDAAWTWAVSDLAINPDIHDRVSLHSRIADARAIEPTKAERDQIAAVETEAQAIYESWSGELEGWRPWQPGGNSLKQDEARALASAKIAGLSALKDTPK